jgi:tRNA A37 threonylcarbamoyladenosine dehydratase
MKNFKDRTQRLLGKDAVALLENALVCVCGLGGVGSWAAEALCRAGIGKLRIVDFDVVNSSNINRQLFAVSSSVGVLKTEVAVKRLLDINPSCVIDARNEFIDKDTIPDLLEPRPDIIIDAIDSLSPKVRLINAAFQAGIPVITSMGAAGRTDPSLIKTGDISESNNCPLAKYVRKKLHRLGVFDGVRCVYSTEKAMHFSCEDQNCEEAELIKGRKRAPLGSISYIPGIFGFMAASEAVNILLKTGITGLDLRQNR